MNSPVEYTRLQAVVCLDCREGGRDIAEVTFSAEIKNVWSLSPRHLLRIYYMVFGIIFVLNKADRIYTCEYCTF